jgi:hypothetical protein
MKKIILILPVAALAITVVFIGCTNAQSKSHESKPISRDSLIKRGNYLVSAIGCDDCHSPKKMGPNGPEIDFERRFSGHPAGDKIGKADTSVMKNGWVLFGMDLTSAVGPWGVSYSANITSDPTGIGNWTEEQFFRAIRRGLSKGIEGNRPLLPPMPWFVYRNLSDDDLRAIFIYLKSTKPVKNIVPQPKQLKDLR